MYKIAAFFILLGWCGLVSAQRNKQSKPDFEPLDVTELSESAALKAETIIVEAERELVLDNEFKALELFKSSLEIDPNNSVVNFKIAEILLKNGEARDALPFARRAVELDGSNKYYLLLAAEVYKVLSDFDEAAKLYARMIDEIEGTESYLFDLAILYQYQGKYPEALQTYQKAEEIFGMNEMVLREKQKIYLRDKNYDALLADWDKLIAENEDEDRYAIELCEFLISQNLTTQAKERLAKIEKNKHANLLLSQIYMNEGNIPKAIELAGSTMNDESVDYKAKLQVLNSFMNAVKTDADKESVKAMSVQLALVYPGVYEVQAYTGDLMFSFKEETKARDYYLKAVRIDPSKFGVWQNILTIESGLDQYDSVIAHADRALEYFPNQAALYYFSGTSYLIQKNYKKSVQMLDMGKKYATDPKLQTIFYGQLGDAYNSLKQYDKSYASYESALKANPNNDHVLNNYSYFLSLRREQMDKALEMSTLLVKLHPENPTYLDTHGWVLYTMRKYKEAVEFLRKAANLRENDGTVLEHYGDVLFQLGKVDEAVEQWKRASQFNDVSEHIEKKIAEKKLYE